MKETVVVIIKKYFGLNEKKAWHQNVWDTIKSGFIPGSVVKNLPDNVGDMDLIPDLGRSHMLWSN